MGVPQVFSGRTGLLSTIGPQPAPPRKTSYNGNTRFRTDEIYETLIELVEVSGLPKAFLAQQAGESAGNVDTTVEASSVVYAATRTYL